MPNKLYIITVKFSCRDVNISILFKYIWDGTGIIIIIINIIFNVMCKAFCKNIVESGLRNLSHW